MKRYTEQVFTRLTKAQKREMKRQARRFNQTPSEYIRNAIVEWMGNN